MNEKKENGGEEKNGEYIILFDIDFIVKIKIKNDEEWICNSEYALYLIYNIKNLKNPHPSINNDESSNDSSYYLNNVFDIEHLIFITNNKENRKQK